MLELGPYILVFCCSFGFVEFETGEDAQAALESMKGESLNGRELVIDYAAERDGKGGGGGKLRYSNMN